jgi:2-(1,2-epoxy-1,2-dihydrophenyl)acetyl-CoA isomerase
MTDASATLRVAVRDAVAHFTLTRADAANTMNLQFGREFLAAAQSIQADARVRAVILSGEGKNFCFGGDLKGMVASGADLGAYLSELTTALHAGLALLMRMNAPLIAAIKGSAAGAGLGLVLAADLAVAGRSAKFTPAYTGVGLTPDAGCTFLLPRAVGTKRAMELLLTNRVLTAAEALDWGLVNQVVDDDQVDETAAALAGRLASGPTAAFGGVKRLLADAEPGLETQLGRESRSIAACGGGTEGREGIAAFLEKRAARF